MSDSLIAIAGLLLGSGSTVAGFIIWLQNSATKRFAAEQEFKQIKINLVEIEELICELKKDLQRTDDGIDRIERFQVEARSYFVQLIARDGMNSSGGYK